MGEFEQQNGPDVGEHSKVNEAERTGEAAGTTKGKRSHRATGNPVGRPRKDGNPAGTTAAAAGNNQPTSTKEKGAANPVLINQQPPVVKKPPKAAAKKKKGSDIDQVAGQMAFFVQGVFALVAARSGDHWSISDDEALNVSLPAARILDRLEISETVSKYSDYAALAVASGAIIIPRVIADQQIKKARQVRPAGGAQLVRIDSPAKVNDSPETYHGNPGPSTIHQGSIADTIDQIIGV